MLDLPILMLAMKSFLILTVAIITSLLVGNSVLAATYQQGDKLTPTEEISGDGYLAGSTIKLRLPVRGELFAAGDTIDLQGETLRSAFLAANSVDISGKVGYNAYVAASDVVVSGEISQDIFIFASDVTFAPSAKVFGNVTIFATKVQLKGKIDGDVLVAASEIMSEAVISGSLKAKANQVSFTGGSIDGKFTYTSPNEAAGRDRVQIAGEVNREVPESRGYGSFLLVNFFSLILFGCFVLLLLAKHVRVVTRSAYGQDWRKNYLAGLLSIFGLPILSLLFFVTLLGWRVGLLVLSVYVSLMLLAAVFAAVLLGKTVMSRVASLAKVSQRRQADLYIALGIGLLIPTLVSLIPYIGMPLASLVGFFFLVVPVVGASVRLGIDQSHNM